VIELIALTKRYGAATAVDSVSLSIAAGAVVGFVGAKGAGKSTLLKLLAGLVPVTSGEATIFEASVTHEPGRVKQLVGYLADETGTYPDLTCAEYLRFFAACHGVPEADREQLAIDLLQLVDLHHRRNELTDNLSRSMRRRLGLARALVHNPPALLLDEPVAGLDPRARLDMRALFDDLRAMGKILLITAPTLADIADVCTNVVKLEAGRVSEVVDMSDVVAPRRIVVKYLGNVQTADMLARAGKNVVEVHQMQAPLPADAQVTPLNQLKEMRISFAGSYAEASELLRSLMHSAVQVVAFGESDQP
jgi:ABC-2 type transport system ATP-binding protein